MKRRNEKKSIIYSNFFIFFLVLILGGVIVSFVKIEYRKREVEKEIINFKNEIQRLESRNNNLESLLGYLSREDYLERQAREYLNLKKPGENVAVVLPSANDDLNKIADKKFLNQNDNKINLSEKSIKEMPNIQEWWKYFFN